MPVLKTLSQSDPEFKKYLLGSFSKIERALPLQSLNVSTDSETVTFKIVPISQIQVPPFFKKWTQILKIKSFILFAFPILLLLFKDYLDQANFDLQLGLFSAFGAAFLFAAINLRNDYRDHLSGLDRVHPESGSRAIQNGWLTALQIKKLSVLFAGLGVLLALPSLFNFPQLFFLVAVVTIIAGIGMSNYRMGLKYRWWTEVAAFLLLGPLLTIGYQLSIGVALDQEVVGIGLISGWLAVYFVHLKNFEAIMVNDQAGFSNSIHVLGFEKSKILIFIWWIVFIFAVDVYHWIYSARNWTYSFVFITLGMSWILRKKMQTMKSPVSSNFQTTLRQLRKLAVILLCIWSIEILSYLLVIELA